MKDINRKAILILSETLLIHSLDLNTYDQTIIIRELLECQPSCTKEASNTMRLFCIFYETYNRSGKLKEQKDCMFSV